MSLTSVNLAGLTLRNPIIAAAGTCGYIREIADVIDPRSIGGIVTKSITPERAKAMRRGASSICRGPRGCSTPSDSPTSASTAS